MGHAINLEADNRLNVQDVAALKQRRLSRPSGQLRRMRPPCPNARPRRGSRRRGRDRRPVRLPRGTVDQAGDILLREGRFIVEPGPDGRLTVRRPNFPAGSTGGNSAHS